MKTKHHKYSNTLRNVLNLPLFLFALMQAGFSFAQIQDVNQANYNQTEYNNQANYNQTESNNQANYNQSGYSQPAVVNPPSWAPPYNNASGSQYYYLPDIECYYDVWHNEFVYLDNGNWIYSPTLPAMYAGYDLFHGHVVILDRNVYQPWMHHELYVSHYPRYYHNVIYPRVVGQPHPYGFNENTRSPIYAPEREIGYRQAAIPERAQPIVYRDANVGTPVKVGANMMRPNRR